jgi:hypothetical protein
VLLLDDPHAATSNSAATATPRPRIRYRKFIPLSPNLRLALHLRQALRDRYGAVMMHLP